MSGMQYRFQWPSVRRSKGGRDRLAPSPLNPPLSSVQPFKVDQGHQKSWDPSGRFPINDTQWCMDLSRRSTRFEVNGELRSKKNSFSHSMCLTPPFVKGLNVRIFVSPMGIKIYSDGSTSCWNYWCRWRWRSVANMALSCVISEIFNVD